MFPKDFTLVHNVAHPRLFRTGFRIYKQTEINVAKSCYKGGVLSSCCLLVQGVCLRYTACFPMQTVRWDGMHEQKEKDIQHGGMNEEAKEKYSH